MVQCGFVVSRKIGHTMIGCEIRALAIDCGATNRKMAEEIQKFIESRTRELEAEVGISLVNKRHQSDCTVGYVSAVTRLVRKT